MRNPSGHAGLIDNAIGLISALFAYVETRAALLAVESKALLLQLAALAAFALGALIAVVFGYIFILGSLIIGIAHLSGISWTWIALGAGLLHIALAVVCVLLAKAKLTGRLYPETRAELKKDQQWLKSLGKTGRKDRAAIKSDIALSRDRMARELSGLRYELDIPRKIKNSFRDQTAIWIGALAAVGLLIAIAPARKKKVYVRAKDNSKENGKGLLEAGALVGVMKFAATLLRPALVKFVTSRITGYSRTRSQATR